MLLEHFGVQQPEADQRIVYEGLHDSKQRLLVFSHHTHGVLTCCPEVTLNTRNFHSSNQHPCKSKWNFLRELLTPHCDFEAIAEINVDYFACVPFKHYVRWMSISKSENVANHRHYSQTPCVIGAPVQPNFWVLTLKPQYFLDIFSQCLLKSVPEDFNLVWQWANIEVLAHLLHQLIFNCWNNAAFFSVILDKDMKGIAIADPAD